MCLKVPHAGAVERRFCAEGKLFTPPSRQPGGWVRLPGKISLLTWMGGGRAGGSFWTLPKCCPTQRGLFDVVFSAPGKSIPSRRCRGEGTCSPRPGDPASDAPPNSRAALLLHPSEPAGGAGVRGKVLPNSAGPACRKKHPFSRRRGEATCSPRPGALASDAPPSSGAALRFCLSKTASGANGGELPNRAGPGCRKKHPFRPAQRGSNLLPSAGRSCIRQPTQQRGCKAVLPLQNCAHCAQSFAAKQQ